MNILNLKYERSICYLQLNRPDKRNALNQELVEQLIGFLKENETNNHIRVLVLSGSNHFFCSGADLEWMRRGSWQSMEQNVKDANLFSELYQTLYNFARPVIAEVEGGAYGGAIGLMACADVVVTHPETKFCFSETSLGLAPATVAPWVVLKTGITHARQAMLTAMPFDAIGAKEMGLVHYVVSREKLSSKAREIAEQIAGNSPAATKETKILLNRITNSIVHIDEDFMHNCSTIIARARLTEEGAEGVNAFFEKRLPSWNIEDEKNDNQ